MPHHEHGGRGGHQGADGVLDALMLPMERAYLMTLTKINASISHALRLSERLIKSAPSLPLFVAAGAADDLFKAVKPAAKPPSQQPGAKKQANDNRKPVDPGKAGSKGSTKWYIDQHGHVRYGVRPAPKGDRFTEAMSDADVAALHSRLEVVAGYDDVLDQFIAEHMSIADWDAEVVKTLSNASHMMGVPLHDFVVSELVDGAGETPEDAEEAWERMTNSMQAILANPEMLKRAQGVVASRKRRDRDTSKWVEATEGLTKKFHEDFLAGDVAPTALRTLALLIENGALFMPKAREVGDASKAGELRTEGHTLETLERFLSDMTPGQMLMYAVGDRLRAVINADEENAADLAFRNPEGEVSDQLPPGMDELLRPEMERVLKRDLSDKEWENIAKRVNEVGESVYKQVAELNNFEGGEAIGMLMREEITAADLFKDKNILKTVQQKIEQKRVLRDAALKAREDPNIEVSNAMLKGFERITEEEIASGRRKKGTKAGLFDYQKKMVNWMLTVKRGILAADTGMGKTPMTIAAISKLLEEKKAKRGILVLPKGLVKQWPKEIKRFMPDANVVTLGEGMSIEDRLDTIEAVNSGELPCDFMIMSASTVDFTKETKDELDKIKNVIDPETGKVKKVTAQDPEMQAKMEELRKNDRMAAALRGLEGAVVFDEMHSAAQGLKTRGNTHWHIAKEMLKNREYSWGMTATPMPNGQPGELFTEMNLIHPGSAGESLDRFERAVAVFRDEIDPDTGKSKKVYADVSDWTEMNKHIAPYVYSKKKTDADVLADADKAGVQRLKDANHNEHTLAMSEGLERLYARAGQFVPHDHLDDPDYKPFDKMHPLAKMMRVLDQQQKMALSPRMLFGADPAKWPPGYNGEQPKIEHMADLVLKHFSAGGNSDRPIVIFSSFPSVFEHVKDELKKRGVDPSLIGEIHGSVDNEDRDAVAEATNSGKIKICLVGVQAGGAGLNLQKKSNKIIFLDKPWRVADVDQAVGRVHRTGQKDVVDVVHMKLQGAIDEGKLENLRRKIGTIEASQYAGLGDDYLGAATKAAIIKLLGSEDSGKTNKTREEIYADLKAMGIQNLPTPEALKEQFDIQKFKEGVDFQQWAEFGGQYVEQMKLVNETRFKNKKITRDQYEAKKRKLAKEELAWNAVVQHVGNTPVAVPKGGGKSVQPPQEYVAPKGVNKFEPGTMEYEIMDAVINKKVRTPEDLVDTVIAPTVAKNAPEDHVETVKPKLLSLARKKFEELERTGHLIPKTGSGEDEDAPMPKPKAGKPAEEPKGKKQAVGKPGKPAAKPAPKAEAKPAKGGFKVVGPATHPKLKGDAAEFWKEVRKVKPTSMDDAIEKLAGGDKSAAVRKFLTEMFDTYRKHGLIA